jgi:hypothetical protein
MLLLRHAVLNFPATRIKVCVQNDVLMNQNWPKHLRRLLLSVMIFSLWAGFSSGSGTDVDVYIEVIGKGQTFPPAGQNLFYVEEVIYLTATPADGWYFNRWMNGAGDDVDDPDSASTRLKIDTMGIN